MSEPLTRQQFNAAVADATAAVVNVYREVEAMFRELALALGDGDPSFGQVVKRLVPAPGRKHPDARHLRNYVANVFAPVIAQPEDDDDDEEGEGEDEEGEEEAPKTKKAILIPVDSGIVLTRAHVYDRNVAGFEPHLLVAVLTRCRVDMPTEPGAKVKVPRSRFKSILSALGRHTDPPGKPFPTGVPVHLEGQAKSKPKSKLIFDLPYAPVRYPLFDLTPEVVRGVAAKTRELWRAATAGGGAVTPA
ncbi:MAG TPA: hypothetical protein VHE35_20385 [Kofleriaceae bacterium]|nr:hypothetical protein [Kofleriaceae bacterium]